MRYNFIKDLINQNLYHRSSAPSGNQHQRLASQQSQLGSGLNFIFLPSDPDELVDQLKLLYLEKVGGNDNPQLNEQIIAIAEKLLQYECITPSQQQNFISV